MNRFANIDQILFGLAYASLLFTLLYYVTGFDMQFNDGFAAEDGPIEWSTTLFLAAASGVLLWRAARLGRDGRIVAALLVAFYGLLFFFGAGEEISWGQRVFGWESGEFFRENNYQEETNIHNLMVGDNQLAKTLFGSILTLVLLLYLVVLTLVYPRVRLIARLVDALAIPVPALRHAALAFGASLLIGVVDLPRKWEVYEFIFSLLAVSIFLAPANRPVFSKN